MAKLYIQIGAIVLNLLLLLMHSVGFLLTAPFQSRRKIHKFCIKTITRLFGQWARGEGNELRFHHRDYAIASLLLPGRMTKFGKWMIFDDIVNYDSLVTFDRYTKVFVFDEIGQIHQEVLPAQHFNLGSDTSRTIEGPTDGTISLVSRGTHPSDNYFVRNWREMVREIACPWKPSPHLDKLTVENHVLIAAVRRIKGPEMNIEIELLRM